MPTIDLHIHTNATPHHSSWTPDALAAAAVQRGLSVIAAADHNSTVSVRALQQAGQRYGVQVISGVEFDSAAGGDVDTGTPPRLWHTLVYGAPPDAPDLLALCDAVFVSNIADAASLIRSLPRYGLVLEGLDELGRPP